MQNIITIGKRLVPVEHIAFVEPYDAAANPRLQSSRDYKARIVLLNRDSLLIEETPQRFAEAHGFRVLEQDQIATNPVVSFAVETFAPAEGFASTKPYATRLLWRDWDGNDQSKLLLASPETVLSVVVRGSDALRTQPATIIPTQESVMQRPSRGKRSAAAATAADIILPRQ